MLIRLFSFKRPDGLWPILGISPACPNCPHGHSGCVDYVQTSLGWVECDRTPFLSISHQSGIDVLVFPAHCTHMLQPFDVSAAAALQCALRRCCEDAKITLPILRELAISETERIWFGQKRRIRFDPFMDMWSVATSRANILSRFRACRIYPLDLETPLHSQFTVPVHSESIYRVHQIIQGI
jgi:hypothetical protein